MGYSQRPTYRAVIAMRWVLGAYYTHDKVINYE